ncbi:uncharacterized protein [Apostichopus japonicus]|uniref:uncharacterized protein isoform X2 n=1 Tax=Stichopus japonicus TaxID=307972 RepID=UPI003AB4249D
MGSSCSSKNSTAVHTPALDPPVAQQPTNGTTVNTKKHVEINSNVTEIKHTDSNRIEEETSQIKETTQEAPAIADEKTDEEKPVNTQAEGKEDLAPVEGASSSPQTTDISQNKEDKSEEPPAEDEAIQEAPSALKDESRIEDEGIQEAPSALKDESRVEPDGAAVETTVEDEKVDISEEERPVDNAPTEESALPPEGGGSSTEVPEEPKVAEEEPAPVVEVEEQTEEKPAGETQQETTEEKENEMIEGAEPTNQETEQADPPVEQSDPPVEQSGASSEHIVTDEADNPATSNEEGTQEATGE